MDIILKKNLNINCLKLNSTHEQVNQKLHFLRTPTAIECQNIVIE